MNVETESQRRARLLEIELLRLNNVPLMQLPAHVRSRLRALGYKEASVDREYVRGRKMGKETADYILGQLKQNNIIVTPNFVWSSQLKEICPQWRAIQKHVNESYSLVTKGTKSKLSPDQRLQLRDFAYRYPKEKVATYRANLYRTTGIVLSESQICEILKQMGATRKAIAYIAEQRSSPANQAYARQFALHLRERKIKNPAYFDESGITPRGMSQRRNDGWAPVGSLGAFVTSYLHTWPPNHCITVQGFLDRDGFWGQECHTGGTDWDSLEPYFNEMARIGYEVRKVDGVIIDNCPSHDADKIRSIFRRWGISVMFLPRYWPQWNPIEICWNWMKDFLMKHIAQFRLNPCGLIRQAMDTVTGELARSWIRHCKVYPKHFYN